MNSNEIRDKIQDNIALTIKRVKDLITLVSVRVGKTRAALKAVEPGEKILVVYPLVDIKTSWDKELIEFTPLSTNITFCTTRSLKKYKDTYWDYLIVDEPQLLSPAQIRILKTITYNKRVGLTGTVNPKTEKTLKYELNWNIRFTYELKDAIRDKLVKDYRIYIHFTPLDTKKRLPYTKFGKTFYGTEAEIYSSHTESMEYFEELIAEAETAEDLGRAKGGYKKYMGLRTNFLYNCESLFKYADKMAQSFRDEKVLIYALRTDIADRLSSVTYHSKNREEEVLERFKSSQEGHLAVVNCVQAGVTIQNLNKVLFHSYESNTEILHQKLARSLLYQFDGEVSEIHIVCLKDTQMEEWVNAGCRSLDQDKIYYVFGESIIHKKEYLKSKYPDLELYMYQGSLVYLSRVEDTGFYKTRYYKFMGSDKEYTLPYKKLEMI